MPFSSPKAVLVLDLDGTLIPQRLVSQWKIIEDFLLQGDMAHLHEEANNIRVQYLTRFDSGEITDEEYHEWYHRSLNVYISAGLAPEMILPAMRLATVRPGVKEFLDVARDENIPVAIISNGIHQAVDGILQSNGVRSHIDRIYSGSLITQGGRFTGVDASSIVLPQHKGHRSLEFAAIHGVPPERILAVGDSIGDLTLGHMVEHRLGVTDYPEKAEWLKQTGAFGEVHHLQNEHFASVIAWFKKKLLAWQQVG